MTESAERIELSPNALILGENIREALALGPEERIRVLTWRVIEFIESGLYLSFAERVEQAADEARYDVWVDWDEANRKRVAVRLGRYLGVGLKAAAEMVEQDRPLAQGLTALEVAGLAARYRAEGLGVRVRPEFRWPLP